MLTLTSQIWRLFRQHRNFLRRFWRSASRKVGLAEKRYCLGKSAKTYRQRYQLWCDHCLVSRYIPARKIQRFWQELGVSFRFLPFHLSIDDNRSAQHGLLGSEQVAALNRCFLDWLSSADAVRIDPLHEYIGYALDYMAGRSKAIYDPDETESVFIANTNGDISGVGQGELYSPELCYGNIFQSSLVDILASQKRKRAISLALSRMHKYCKQCSYFGHCPGHHVAHSTKEDLAILEDNGCTIRHVVGFIVHTLNLSDIRHELTRRTNEI
jgi:radical SAM protein with 4Fe4S-binding SPASM domain